MDAKTVATVLCFILGFFVIVVPLFMYVRKGSLGKEGVALVVLGIILLGVPVFWSSVQIDIGDIKISLDNDLKELSVENEQLAKDVNRLGKEKAALIDEVNMLKKQFDSLQKVEDIAKNDAREINSSFNRIENKTKVIEESSAKLEQKLKDNSTKLSKVQDLVNSIK